MNETPESSAPQTDDLRLSMQDKMDSSQYQRIREIFDKASRCDATQRQAVLQRECGGDERLQAEVESLLQHLDEPQLDLDSACEDIAEIVAGVGREETTLPEQVGHYRILDKLGEGGMGVVYLAEQDRPRRIVALKLMRPGLTTSSTLRRFEREAEVLGRLHHPGIAQIFEADVATVSGISQPYFAMEHVEGVPLTQYADDHMLETPDRIRLMVDICRAVDHAHQHDVVHRDLKPGNILITADGRPKILDFGVARLTDSDVQTTTLDTHTGQLIGTIAYMSPEQVNGDSTEIDQRADVYALGVLLCELLTGSLPFDLAGKSMIEAARIVRDEEPTTVASLNRSCRGDLNTIVAKALEKDKGRRYESAADLADDLQRYLNDEPIKARPPSTLYQLGKFTRRNRALVTGVALTFCALVLGIIGTSVFAYHAVQNSRLAAAAQKDAEREARRATEANQLAQQRLEQTQLAQQEAEREANNAQLAAAQYEAINKFLTDMLRAANPYSVDDSDLRVVDVIDDASLLLDTSFPDQPLVEAFIRRILAETYDGLGADFSALEELDRAVELQLAAAPDDLHALAGLLYRKGATLNEVSRFDEARDVLTEAAAIQRQLGGGEIGSLSLTLAELALTAHHQDELERANELYEQALAVQRDPRFGEPADLAMTLNNYAALLRTLGRYHEAEDALRESLALRTKTYGEDDLTVAESLDNLGNILLHLGRQVEAQEVIERSLHIREQRLAPDHPRILATKHNLANTYDQAGRIEEAEAMLREVVEARLASEDGVHPDLSLNLMALGQLERRLGKYAEAEKTLRSAIEGLLRDYGPDNSRTVTAKANLANVLLSVERYDEAEQLQREALIAMEGQLPEGHPQIAALKHNIAHTLRKQGEVAEGEQMLREALEVVRAAFGEKHGAVAQILHNVGVFNVDLERYDTAEAFFQQALAVREGLFEPPHPALADTLFNLGVLMQERGDQDAARTYLEQSLAMRIKVFGDDHAFTAEVRDRLNSLDEQ